MLQHAPSPDGSNGSEPQVAKNRGPKGHFAPGNPGGKGNPHAKAVAKLRSAMMAAVTPEDVQEVVYGLVYAAKQGRPWAVKELLDRLFGKSGAIDFMEMRHDREAAATARGEQEQ